MLVHERRFLTHIEFYKRFAGRIGEFDTTAKWYTLSSMLENILEYTDYYDFPKETYQEEIVFIEEEDKRIRAALEKFSVRIKERKPLTIDKQFIKRLKEYHEHIEFLKEIHKDASAGSMSPYEEELITLRKFVSETKDVAKMLRSILEIVDCPDFPKDQFEQEILWIQEQLLLNQIVLDKQQKRLCELEAILKTRGGAT